MSMRYKGAVISATPPTTSTSAATGVWTLVQQMQAQGAGTWPVVIGGTYWIGLLGSASDDDTAFSMAVDTSGNVYIWYTTTPWIVSRYSNAARLWGGYCYST